MLNKMMPKKNKMLVKPKPKNRIDIDAQDKDNELAAVEYVEDMYEYYKQAEKESKTVDYMHTQPEITSEMRDVLIDWLIGVHDKLELRNETLYLTVNIVDRFLAADKVAKRDLQCVGMSAMLLASKYQEMQVRALGVDALVKISEGAYENQQVLGMEKRIVGGLEWELSVPTPYVFLLRYIKAAAAGDVTPPEITTMENMVHFYAELGVMSYDINIRFCPSMLSAAAVYAARATLNLTPVWHHTLEMHTGFSEAEVMECAKRMVLAHSLARRRVVYGKYSSATRGAVALYPPAKHLLTAY